MSVACSAKHWLTGYPFLPDGYLDSPTSECLSAQLIPFEKPSTGGLPTRPTRSIKNPANPDRIVPIIRLQGPRCNVDGAMSRNP